MKADSGGWFFFFYRALIWPTLRAIFKLLGLFNRKIAKGLEMRRAKPWAERASLGGSPAVWIHCASGEFEYAKPVITLLKAERPEARVIVTFFSPTFANAVKNFPGVDFACPLPWDTPHALGEFLEAQAPEMLLIARTDTWPEMLRQAKTRNLPTLLFSATFSRRAGRAASPLARWMSRVVFRDLDNVYCVSSADLAAFTELGLAGKSLVAGDTRYDQVMARLRSPKPLREELFTGHERARILICGSTWLEDEKVLMAAAGRLTDAGVALVLVPHEPTAEHLTTLENEISKNGLTAVRYSNAESWSPGQILIVDKIGLLAELYMKGALAFVGGSFKKTVHSVMEPLASGALTFVGPLHENNREALEFKAIPATDLGHKQVMMTCVQPVSDADDLVKKCLMATDLMRLGGPADKIRSEIVARSGKSRLVVEWILRHSGPNSRGTPQETSAPGPRTS